MHRMTHYLFWLILANLSGQTASEAIHLLKNEMGFGARALSMGGAAVASSNDPASMYWNPAALTGMTHGNFYMEGNNLFYMNKTTYVGQTTDNPLQKYGTFNGFGVAYPIPTVRGSLVLALGYNKIVHYDGIMSFSGFSLKDNELAFPITVDGKEKEHKFSEKVQRSEHVISNGGLQQLTFSFGVALSPTTSGGLSISRITGREDYEFKFGQEDIQNRYTQFPADFHEYQLVQSLITQTSGWQIRGGFKQAINEWVHMGMALSLPFTLRVEEQHGTDENLIFDNGENAAENVIGYYDYKVKMPLVADVGLSLTVSKLAIHASLRFKDWGATQFDLKDVDRASEDYEYLSEENSQLKFQYRPVVQLRAGMEYLLEINKQFGITLRSGGGVIPSPDGDSKVDQNFFAFGVGVPLYDAILIDATYMGAQWEKKSSDGYTPSGATEAVNTGRLLINVSYLF